jgi:hypothetical protein
MCRTTKKRTPPKMSQRVFTKEELEELSRKDLQNEAKRVGVKANLKVPSTHYSLTL